MSGNEIKRSLAENEAVVGDSGRKTVFRYKPRLEGSGFLINIGATTSTAAIDSAAAANIVTSNTGTTICSRRKELWIDYPCFVIYDAYNGLNNHYNNLNNNADTIKWCCIGPSKSTCVKHVDRENKEKKAVYDEERPDRGFHYGWVNLAEIPEDDMILIQKVNDPLPVYRYELLPPQLQKIKWCLGRIMLGSQPGNFIAMNAFFLFFAGTSAHFCWTRFPSLRPHFLTPILVLAAIALASLWLVFFTDPGIIPRNPPCSISENSLIFDYPARPGENNPVYERNKFLVAGNTDNQTICIYCNIKYKKGHKIVHCPTCNACVIGWDHHCLWIGNCVAQRNYMYFLTYVLSLLAFSLLVIALIGYRIGYVFWTYRSSKDVLNEEFKEEFKQYHMYVMFIISVLYLLFFYIVIWSKNLARLKGMNASDSNTTFCTRLNAKCDTHFPSLLFGSKYCTSVGGKRLFESIPLEDFVMYYLDVENQSTKSNLSEGTSRSSLSDRTLECTNISSEGDSIGNPLHK